MVWAPGRCSVPSAEAERRRCHLARRRQMSWHISIQNPRKASHRHSLSVLTALGIELEKARYCCSSLSHGAKLHDIPGQRSLAVFHFRRKLTAWHIKHGNQACIAHACRCSILFSAMALNTLATAAANATRANVTGCIINLSALLHPRTEQPSLPGERQ